MRLAFLSIGRHIHTERWIRWFAAQGHECHLLTVQPGPVPDVTVHDIRRGGGPKAWRYAQSLGVVRGLLRRLQPQLLNTHFLTGYGYWGHFSGFHPNVLTVWGDDVYVTPHETPLKGWLARRALRSCDALTGDSLDILAAAGRLGADPERSFRVLWGVDFDRFRPGDAGAWRAAQGCAPEDVLVLSPRSFTQAYYNIDTVIAAAAQVARAEPRARFLFAGYEGDPAPFRARAQAAGLGDAARFLGRLTHEEFATALRASDIFVSVPSVDATAVSLLEAMSCSCAVVVSRLSSSLEWIVDDESGCVVPARAASALAAVLLRLCRDPHLRRRLGAAALARARRDAGFAPNMQRVDRIFATLTSGTPDWPREVSLRALGAPAGGTGS